MGSRLSTLLFACALSSIVTLAAAGGKAQSGPQEVDPNARAAFEAGRDAYDRGRFEEALASFERAYQLSPHPLLLYNIGRAAESDLQNQRALEAYSAYLKALPSAENREFVEARIAKLRQLTAAQPAPSASTPATTATTVPPSTSTGPGVVQPYATPYVYNPTAAGAPRAARKRSIPGFRLYAGARLGAGGSASFAAGRDEKAQGDLDDATLDLKPTFGFQLGIGYGWRVFGLEAEFRIYSLKIEGDDRLRTYDAVVRPRFGYQLASKPLEIYAALPIGVSVAPEQATITDGYGQALDYDLTVGGTFGLQLGLTYMFIEHVGLNLETGPVLHAYAVKTTPFSSWGDTYRGGLAIWHWNVLSANVMFAL